MQVKGMGRRFDRFFRNLPTAWMILATWCLLLPSMSQASSAVMTAVAIQESLDQGNHPHWWLKVIPEKVTQEIQTKVKHWLDKLELEPDQSDFCRKKLEEHYRRVWSWHQEVDFLLDEAWKHWDEARTDRENHPKDEYLALVIMHERIDPLYASFAPQIHQLLQSLRSGVGETTTVLLLDEITRSPGAERTYRAYLEMIPEMTHEQKKILWERMVLAREESLAAWSSKRVIKIFKKHKVRNEHSIDTFGYDYRSRYQAWAKGLR